MNILIVDDHKIFREGFERALRLNENIKSVYHAENGIDALLILERYNLDLVFMDIQMKVMDGITATSNICKKHPQIKIIALSQFEDSYHAIKMFECGAKGYLIKTAGIDEINKALNLVMKNEIYYAPEIARLMAEYAMNNKTSPQASILSKREFQILNLICSGKTDKMIAEEVFISIRTVEWHRRNILDKTNTKSGTELINFAIKNGIYFP